MQKSQLHFGLDPWLESSGVICKLTELPVFKSNCILDSSVWKLTCPSWAVLQVDPPLAGAFWCAFCFRRNLFLSVSQDIAGRGKSQRIIGRSSRGERNCPYHQPFQSGPMDFNYGNFDAQVRPLWRFILFQKLSFTGSLIALLIFRIVPVLQ